MVTWNIKIEKNLPVDGVTPAGFTTTGLDEASRYTDDMNKVIKAYKKGNNRPANTYVLFFVEATNKDKEGYMPLTGNYGFIFKSGINIELWAHELSHGAFNLKHTFSEKAFWQLTGPAPKFAEKSTQNLMDYANGIELWKYQWDLIHNPETIVLGSLDEDEGARIDGIRVNGIPKTILELFEYGKKNECIIKGDTKKSRENIRDALMKDYYIFYNSPINKFEFNFEKCKTDALNNSKLNSYEKSEFARTEKYAAEALLNTWDIFLFERQLAKEKQKIEVQKLEETEKKKELDGLCEMYYSYKSGKNIRIATSVVIIAGGVATIYFSAGTGSLAVGSSIAEAVSTLGVISGGIAVVGGIYKLSFDAVNMPEYADIVPTGIGELIGVTIQITAGDTKTTQQIRAVLDAVEGCIYLKGKVPLETILNTTNTTISIIDCWGELKCD